MLPEINIGTVGHVDHGKTSLVYALTGKWADTHSEELKRGITIRLGYADATIYFCSACSGYRTAQKCTACFGECTPKRAVSFVDLPGHETLMATVLSGAALLDGALLIIAANEHCPQPQTAEHLKVLDVAGIRNVIIVQSKIDLVSEEQALKNYEQIMSFVRGTVAEHAPVIPISAMHAANIDALLMAIEEHIPTPLRNEGSAQFFVARSFDVNRPGTAIRELHGAVVGGSFVSGELSVGDEIEIRPGIGGTSLKSRILGIMKSGINVKEARPGGLVALQTDLDPSLSRSDALAGNVLGNPVALPPVTGALKLKVSLFDHVIGVEGQQKVEKVRTGDVLMLTVGIGKTVGKVVSAHNDIADVTLKLPVCARKGDRVSISRQIAGRWHLIGYGIIV